MNSKAIAAYLLLSVAVCADKSPPCAHELQRRQPSIPGLPTPPPCGSCVNDMSPEFLASLNNFAPTYDETLAIATALRTSRNIDLQEIKANIAKEMKSMKDAFVAALGKIATGAATIGSCPAVKAFYDNLGRNVDALMTAYIEDWPSFVNGTGVASITDALQKAVTKSIPSLLTLYRDMLYNIVMITPLCPTLGPIIYLVFDSEGIGVQLLSTFLDSGGSLVTAFVTSAYGSFIPGNVAVSGSLDVFQIMRILACAIHSAIVVGVDPGEPPGDFCPAGSIGGSFDPIGLFKDILCRFLIVIEPSAANDGEVCAPGSSQGGGSSVSQGLLTGLLCLILNLVGLGGLLGCPSSGGSSNPVQALMGLICELKNALSSLGIYTGGFSIPFCPIG